MPPRSKRNGRLRRKTPSYPSTGSFADKAGRFTPPLVSGAAIGPRPVEDLERFRLRDLLKRMGADWRDREAVTVWPTSRVMPMNVRPFSAPRQSLEAESQTGSSTRTYGSHKAAISGSSALYGVG